MTSHREDFMLLKRTFAAAGIATVLVAASFATALAEDASALKPTVAPVLQSSTTIIGQDIAYPKGEAQVTAAIVTIPPGGQTGWHVHPVPLFGYMLEGELTVDYGDKGTHTYKTGEALMEAMNWPHNGMNKGTVPVRILTVYSGAKGIANAEPVAH
jgi:quercetin dioxygenase-like cupin family protein